ncbi:MAG: serine/threonine protein kinase [Labilithrix sp.]|nr:serine/threonine protein kinase [Labilithrix sp.]
MRDGPTTIGNYMLCGELAKGGMATIYIGHAIGSTRPLAIKKMDVHGSSAELVTMFLDELALAGSVKHRNIVQTIDVVSTEDDLCLVMEYIEGETVSKLLRACREQALSMPIAIVAGVVCAALQALHAVHEATGADGKPLEIVHRDVSPQNIVVGVDGVTRLLDFGVAKAAVRLQQTRTGELKGKVAYMAPEQLERHEVTKLTDLYAMAVVLWEALAGQRLFEAETEGQLVRKVMMGTSDPPSSMRPGIPPELDAVVMRALAKETGDRYQSARHFAGAIENATTIARAPEISEWVQTVAKKTLEGRARRVAGMLSGVRTPGGAASPPSSSRMSVAAASAPSFVPSVPSATPSVGTGLRSRVMAEDATSPGTSRMAVTGTTKATGKHVLIIDDSAVILENARRVLEADGYRVTTTTQTVGAAKHLVDCDLALIDFHMPGFNGAAVIESLRGASTASGKTCLFYLFTSDQEIAKDYGRMGFDGSLTGKGDDGALLRGVRAAFRVLQMRAMKK